MNLALWGQINVRFFAGQLQLDTVEMIAGGDICQSYRVSDALLRMYFIKIHVNQKLLGAEHHNLQTLQAASIRTPKVLGCLSFETFAVLIMEYLSLSDSGDEYLLGQSLAQLHTLLAPDTMYGFDEDNFIGHNPQYNSQSPNWEQFWWSQRLEPQLLMAQGSGFSPVSIARIRECTHALLADHQPAPSLLHGDLWSGNKAFLANGEPVLFDPATYYGDRETDLAFTHVFGGFNAGFYRGYHHHWPLPAGANQRQSLYNLYHLLNHYNLFGSGYVSSVYAELERLGLQA
ncbi:fructosamine kinase family protein [Gilvimarinus agarilyticus]|uniref:fructosamine kinase family protein n=1 Tax=Gilvimarinus sp. 2_MG-2023 TaxID=3062666 RepID=UPI001C0A27D6|nr:fructosamine kinase family protein [Gilvimarinus sp. 2_MG-2023]MBU2884207.1 fructosamine kinase family protein [Gilvimarinus agarilyticus]MDO6569346.1 fructosamine kinase family protein [Gilvimarinus sp. 2_MG-2023]